MHTFTDIFSVRISALHFEDKTPWCWLASDCFKGGWRCHFLPGHFFMIIRKAAQKKKYSEKVSLLTSLLLLPEELYNTWRKLLAINERCLFDAWTARREIWHLSSWGKVTFFSFFLIACWSYHVIDHSGATGKCHDCPIVLAETSIIKLNIYIDWFIQNGWEWFKI